MFEPHDARIDDGAGFPEDLVLKPSARLLRPVRAEVDGRDEGVDPTDADLNPMGEELVPMLDILAWGSPGASEGTHVAVRRLAALLGVAAIVVVVMMLILAASTEITSVFSRLSGS